MCVLGGAPGRLLRPGTGKCWLVLLHARNCRMRLEARLNAFESTHKFWSNMSRQIQRSELARLGKLDVLAARPAWHVAVPPQRGCEPDRAACGLRHGFTVDPSSYSCSSLTLSPEQPKADVTCSNSWRISDLQHGSASAVALDLTAMWPFPGTERPAQLFSAICRK